MLPTPEEQRREDQGDLDPLARTDDERLTRRRQEAWFAFEQRPSCAVSADVSADQPI